MRVQWYWTHDSDISWVQTEYHVGRSRCSFAVCYRALLHPRERVLRSSWRWMAQREQGGQVICWTFFLQDCPMLPRLETSSITDELNEVNYLVRKKFGSCTRSLWSPVLWCKASRKLLTCSLKVWHPVVFVKSVDTQFSSNRSCVSMDYVLNIVYCGWQCEIRNWRAICCRVSYVACIMCTLLEQNQDPPGCKQTSATVICSTTLTSTYS